jgi:elongation factor P
MISTLNDIKKGINVVRDGEPYNVVEANFVRMQACKPTMQTKMKNLINGKVIEHNFHAGEKVEEADLLKKKVDYLYANGEKYNFMASDDFEQFELPKESIEKIVPYLKEGDKVDAIYFNGNPVSLSLPLKVELKVASTPDGVKGDSAQGRVTKAAEMETGLTVQVPLFIKDGDTIKVNSETGEYSERV